MTDTSQLTFWTRIAASIALSMTGIIGLMLVLRMTALPDNPSPPDQEIIQIEPFAPARMSIGQDWRVFQAPEREALDRQGLSQRYRLAGTFFVSGEGGEDVRKAVLDLLVKKEQKIVSEGDRFDDISVIRILDDRIVLRERSREETLYLSFDGHTDSTRRDSGPADEPLASVNEPGGSTNRFGQAVGPSNWVFRRDSLMAYYDELMNDPVRLLQVFDSMKPLYNQDGTINGYVLDVEGEREFFDAVGFREGDVVRKVNAVPMTNRRRAEYFISQFANDSNMNVFVIDIEREGEPVRMVYRIRE